MRLAYNFVYTSVRLFGGGKGRGDTKTVRPAAQEGGAGEVYYAFELGFCRGHCIRGGVIPAGEVVVLDPLLGESRAAVGVSPSLLHAAAVLEDLGRLLSLLQLARTHVRIQLRQELWRGTRLILRHFTVLGFEIVTPFR